MAERIASWRCDACPGDRQVLRPGPHYVDREAAHAAIRVHFVTEHPEMLWNPATRALVAGDVEIWATV